ncbi:hypothetical protein HF086_010444 [Spodoptera exigua]|uniref:Peptidase S1 domain-containing protein n=1 Tax=Spodoptera exigua TaxID=7107 RepID=A0A922MT21_SPOEX|nr:hypothetical protein HF086_010444 [Spodoptera exigua]
MVQIRYFAVFLYILKVTEGALEPFVVGGSKANIVKFPHSAFLETTCYAEMAEDPLHWTCGASVLNQKVILTAAHCIHGCTGASMYSVKLGHAHRKKGFSSIIKNYTIHEYYSPDLTSYDIALAATTTSIEFNLTIKRIAIMEHPPYFEKAQIAGWGLIGEISPRVGNFLRYIDQFVWKHEACEQTLYQIPVGTICASSGKPFVYASRGDSGSALIVRGYIQIGLVSYKLPRVSRSLVVYTDTGYFYNWIKKNAKILTCA